LTIDEYRNKLYQFIQQTKSQSSLSSKNNHKLASSNNSQTKSEAYIRANTPAKEKTMPPKTTASTYKPSHDINDEYYNNPTQHNNSHTYESKSDHSDDTASSNGTPPHQNYYHSSNLNNNNNSSNNGTSYNNSTSSLSNYNKRQKHPSDYSISTNPNLVPKQTDQQQIVEPNQLGGVAGYTGVAFGRTTHGKPQPPVNIYSKNHQKSIAAARQRSMENLNASMVSFGV